MTTINIQDLEALCRQALQKAGLRDQDITDTIEHLLENELSGKSSHGMVRVVEAIKVVNKFGTPTQDPTIETDTGSMVTLNANRQIGVVACKTAMNIAIERAKAHGIALVGVHDYIATSGSMAFYLRRLAEEGLVALMGCNSVAMVTPPGGRERQIGTNPFGIAVPGENGEALIADFGTAAIAYGKIMVMKDKGQPVPEGLMIDKNGNPSTNPDDAYDGSILPLADYKGFALGLMIELLAGPLIGGRAIKKKSYDNDGLFIIAIDPKMTGQNQFYHYISKALTEVQNTPTQSNHDSISLPGQRSEATLKQAKERGEIDIAEKTLHDLKQLAEEGL